MYCVLTEALRKDHRDAASLIRWNVPPIAADFVHVSPSIS